MAPPRETIYHSYLLRLWCDRPDGAWHASLRATGSGKDVTFGTLAEMFAYIEERCVRAAGASPADDPPEGAG